MKSTNLLSRTCIAMVLTMLATTTAIAQTQAIHTLKMTDGTVNQNYNTDALIDMQSTSKGLLLPRVELTSTTAAAPLAAHTAGMVVYNTVTVNDVTPGFYYNDGSKWVSIGRDNLGNHIASKNIDLTTYALIGNTGTKGIKIAANGVTTIQNLPDFIQQSDTFIVVSNKDGELKKMRFADMVEILNNRYHLIPSESASVKSIYYTTTWDIWSPPILTSATLMSNSDILKISDNDASTFIDVSENNGAWFYFDVAKSYSIKSVYIVPSISNGIAGGYWVGSSWPTNINLFGSNDGISWTACVTAQTPSTNLTNNSSFTLSVNGQYRYYALMFNVGNNSSRAYIGEITFNF